MNGDFEKEDGCRYSTYRQTHMRAEPVTNKPKVVENRKINSEIPRYLRPRLTVF